MRLIITGHDYAGKTTYLRDFWNLIGNDKVSYIHLSYKDPTSYEFYNSILDFDNFIMDRCFLDELIYPEIFNRKSNLTIKEAKLLIDKCNRKGIKIFILECSDREIRRRILYSHKDEEVEVLNNIYLIKRKYREIAKLFNLKIIAATNKIDLYKIVNGGVNE